MVLGLLGPLLGPSWISGYPGLGRDSSFGGLLVPFVSHIRAGGDGGCSDPLPWAKPPSTRGSRPCTGGSTESPPSTPCIKKHGEVLRHPHMSVLLMQSLRGSGGGEESASPPPAPIPNAGSVSAMVPGTPSPAPGLSPLHPTPPIATLDTGLTAGDGWGQASAAGARDVCGEVTDTGVGGCKGGEAEGLLRSPPLPCKLHWVYGCHLIAQHKSVFGWDEGCWGSGDGLGGNRGHPRGDADGFLSPVVPRRWWHWTKAEIPPCFAQSQLFSPNRASAFTSALGLVLKSYGHHNGEETLWAPYAAGWPRWLRRQRWILGRGLMQSGEKPSPQAPCVHHVPTHVPCPAAPARPHPSPAVSRAVAAGLVSSGEMRRCERRC